MYSYASVNCHRTAEGDRKAAEMKCPNQNHAEVEWPFDTYIEPPVTMGQINLDPELHNNGPTQFLSNSNGFCYPDYSAEVSKNPHNNNMLSQELSHERHGLLLNPENDVIATSLVHHNGYTYEPCRSGVTDFVEQGDNNDLMKGYVPPFVGGYEQGYQEMGCHEFPVSIPHPPHPHPHPPRLHHSTDPNLEIGFRGAKENSQFLNSLSMNGDVARSTNHEEYHRCYGGGDPPNIMPHPPFIKSPASSVSLMDISQSHLDDGLHHEVIRRRRRREQNRIAARKCREKKKENVDNMLKDYTETLRENERLRLETEKLQSLVASLQTIVKSHQTTCNFSSAAV